MNMSLQQMLALSPEELIAAVLRGDIAESQVQTYPLDTAQSNLFIPLKGTFFGIIGATDATVTIDIEFNRLGSGVTTFTKGLYVQRPFGGIYLTNTAQAGKSITIVTSMLSDLFRVFDNRTSGDTTTYLTTIQTNTGNTASRVRSLDGDTGTQVVKYGQASSTTTVIHTVTAAKTFYWSHYTFKVQPSVGGDGYLIVTDGSDVEQYKLMFLSGSTAGINQTSSGCFPHPVKIPAGYKIKVNGTGTIASGFITGWEE